jgi:superfamily II DNA/RNA helicase
VLIFTEFTATQAMLRAFLESRGFQVVTLNGAMSREEREAAQRAFAGEAQIMVSTDAGGEGLNLQFCNVVVNYDLPWNPSTSGGWSCRASFRRVYVQLGRWRCLERRHI